MASVTDIAPAQVELRRFDELGAANHGWLDTRFHFSFADYRDPARMNWGAIRVWNDDVIAANSGFPAHPHRDMEIITYVREGAISHRDSLGNEGRTAAGDVQVMSAGSGISHSEYNAENMECRLFQIWILPDRAGGEPCWGMKPFPKGERAGRLQLLASGFGEDDALAIRAAARLFGATLSPDDAAHHVVGEGRRAYLVPACGAIEANGVRVEARDGLAIGEGALTLRALEPAEIVLVDARA